MTSLTGRGGGSRRARAAATDNQITASALMADSPPSITAPLSAPAMTSIGRAQQATQPIVTARQRGRVPMPPTVGGEAFDLSRGGANEAKVR